jgi:hypothetical protein
MNVELMASARRSVLEQLAIAHDHWAEEEQRLVGEDRHIEAQGAHEIATSLLRAYRAELDDPKPKEPVQ